MQERTPEHLQSDATYMRDFMGTKTYDIWVGYLEQLGEDWTQRLVNGVRDPETILRYAQGVLQGLMMAKNVPENVIKWAQASGNSDVNLTKP